MAGPSASNASRRPSYSATTPAIHRRAAVSSVTDRIVAVAAALTLALMTCGCAVSGLGFGKDANALASADTTGSIPSSRLSTGLPPDADLAYARAAITEVLSVRAKDFSTSWENPKSGARGTVTPIATAYQQDGLTCHDFLASHISGRAETWMRGEACQQAQGAWEVRVLRPWKRT